MDLGSWGCVAMTTTCSECGSFVSLVEFDFRRDTDQRGVWNRPCGHPGSVTFKRVA